MPARATVRAKVLIAKLAVALLFEVICTEQVAAVPEQSPDHPVKVELIAAVAVRMA